MSGHFKIVWQPSYNVWKPPNSNLYKLQRCAILEYFAETRDLNLNMEKKRINYDESFNADMQTFLELIKRNKVIVEVAMKHKNPNQLFSIAVRMLIQNFNANHANDKPLTQSQIDTLKEENRGKKKNE